MLLHYVFIMLPNSNASLFLCPCLLGTYAVMSVMIGGVTERLAPDSDFMTWDNVTNTSIIDTVARDEERVRVAAAVTFISGLFQVNIRTHSKFPPCIPNFWRHDGTLVSLSLDISSEQIEILSPSTGSCSFNISE